MKKESIKAEYNRIKNLLGKQPSQKQFILHSKYDMNELRRVFGRKPFSKLASECGDIPRLFSTDKTEFTQILLNYGKLTRNLGYLPAASEWNQYKMKPSLSSLYHNHNTKWSEMPGKFRESFSGEKDWKDVLSLIPDQQKEESINFETESCFVYLLIDTSNQLYKIGISKSAKYREKTLQSEKPSVKMLAKKQFVNRRMAASFEKALHETYSHKRKRGEWFLLDENDVQELLDTLND